MCARFEDVGRTQRSSGATLRRRGCVLRCGRRAGPAAGAGGAGAAVWQPCGVRGDDGFTDTSALSHGGGGGSGCFFSVRLGTFEPLDPPTWVINIFLENLCSRVSSYWGAGAWLWLGRFGSSEGCPPPPRGHSVDPSACPPRRTTSPPPSAAI